jgi:hypothetical protein
MEKEEGGGRRQKRKELTKLLKIFLDRRWGESSSMKDPDDNAMTALT